MVDLTAAATLTRDQYRDALFGLRIDAARAQQSLGVTLTNDDDLPGAKQAVAEAAAFTVKDAFVEGEGEKDRLFDILRALDQASDDENTLVLATPAPAQLQLFRVMKALELATVVDLDLPDPPAPAGKVTQVLGAVPTRSSGTRRPRCRSSSVSARTPGSCCPRRSPTCSRRSSASRSSGA